MVSPSLAGRYRTAIAVAGGAAALFSLPFVVAKSKGGRPVVDTSRPLKQDALRRGAFNNSGSRDLGPEYVAFAERPDRDLVSSLHMASIEKVNSSR
jgi:hypothetical protein